MIHPDNRPLAPALPQSLHAGWRAHVYAFGRLLCDTLLPQNCALCDQPSGASAVCTACCDELPRLDASQCTRCALPLGKNLQNEPVACPDCARHAPAFDSATAIWSYGFPVDTLIRDFKYGHHLYLGNFLSLHLARALRSRWAQPPMGIPESPSPPDVIVPMPLHPIRLKERGFNQAAEIARLTARHLTLPWRSDLLMRLHHTPSQAGLHRAERWANLRGVFACPTTLQGARVLLIDDVLTTGASLSACAEALRHAGASRIDVAVLARTPDPGNTAHLLTNNDSSTFHTTP